MKNFYILPILALITISSLSACDSMSEKEIYFMKITEMFTDTKTGEKMTREEAKCMARAFSKHISDKDWDAIKNNTDISAEVFSEMWGLLIKNKDFVEDTYKCDIWSSHS